MVSPGTTLDGPAMSADLPPPRHIPVLVAEVVEVCGPTHPRVVVDGTLGMGGHAEALLTAYPDIERYVGLDRDAEALEMARGRLERFGSRVELVHRSFDEVGAVLDEKGIAAVDFALFDLGVSSFQLDESRRGFSFGTAGPLDMRMDSGAGQTALDLLRTLDEGELREILVEFGEVDFAGRIARNIKEKLQDLTTTTELAEVVTRAIPPAHRRKMKIHPATQVFQALRIAVNGELEALEKVLPGIDRRLAPQGRLAVISFHSLEDRIVKNYFRDQSGVCRCPPTLPVCRCEPVARLETVTRRPVMANDDEVAVNPRSRSAKMRVARLAGPARKEDLA